MNGAAGPAGDSPVARSTRPKPIGWMTLTVAAVLYLAGSNIGSGWVVILSAAMIGALVMDLGAVWWSSRGLTVVATLATSATTTTWPDLHLDLSRPGLGTSVQLSDKSGQLRVLMHYTRAGVDAVIPFARGYHTSTVTVARTTGPLGLAHSTRVFTGGAALACRPGILPAEGRLRVLLGGHDGQSDGAVTRGDSEVRGVREFSVGDARRSVHWRSTARQGRLMVRELESPQDSDLRIGIGGGTWSVAALDLATQTAASLATAASRNGHGVEVAVDGATLTWDDETHHHLATLPPASGIPTRPLVPGAQHATIWLLPTADGVLLGRGRGAPDLVRDQTELAAWLRAA